MAVRAAFALLLVGTIGTPPRVIAQGPQTEASKIVQTFQFVAINRAGQPVTDLHIEEIRVSDGKKSVPLAFSRFVPPILPVGGAAPPREFRNWASGRPLASTVILLDLFNADFNPHSTAWEETIQTLGKLESGQNIFMYLLAPDASLVAIHDWGSPAPDESAVPWTRDAHELLDQAWRSVEKIKRPGLMSNDQIANITYQALNMLGTRYAELPGPKRLIWITRGTPLIVSGPTRFPQPLVYQSLLQTTGADFRRLGVSIYTVARAVDGLAPLTGGRGLANEAVSRAIQEAQTDARATYQAGFYIAGNDADGKFHELRVSTTRKDVRILAANGFTAEPLETVEQRELELLESRPFDTPDVRLSATFDMSQGITHFQIRVDPRDLLLQLAGESLTGKLLLAFVYSDANGSLTATVPVSVNVNLTHDQLDAATKSGYTITVDQALPPGTGKVRIVIQDAATGIAGSVSIPLG
jgi:hypothetical protein